MFDISIKVIAELMKLMVVNSKPINNKFNFKNLKIKYKITFKI